MTRTNWLHAAYPGSTKPAGLPVRTLRLQMMRLGCSSTGSERMSAATSSAVFHLASWDRRFWPAHTLQGQGQGRETTARSALSAARVSCSVLGGAARRMPAEQPQPTWCG